MMLSAASKKLLQWQHLHGFHHESLRFIDTMVLDAKEPNGAMGNDTAPAIMSDKRRSLTEMKKHAFAQVTNPSVHPYTEMDIMSLDTFLGTYKGIDGETTNKVFLETPIVTKKTLDKLFEKFCAVEIDCTFDKNATFEEFRQRINEIKTQAEEAAQQGKIVLLTNEHASRDKVPFELDMIGPVVHLHLLEKGLRGKTSLVGRPMEAHTTHDMSCLLSDGFDLLNPHLLEHTIAERHHNGKYGDQSFEQSFKNCFSATDFGIITIMAKKGICAVESWRGGFETEGYGLGKEYVKEFAPGVHSEIGGFELEDLYERAVRFHNESYVAGLNLEPLPNRGIRTIQHGEHAESHANIVPHILKLQTACALKFDIQYFVKYYYREDGFDASWGAFLKWHPNEDDENNLENTRERRLYDKYKHDIKVIIDQAKQSDDFERALEQLLDEKAFELFLDYADEKRDYNVENPTQIRDLWDLEYVKDPRDVTEEDLAGVQPLEEIIELLGVAGMSFGSTSPEQHKDTEDGARMAGARWQSGEGGLPKSRKNNVWELKGVQVASGRFIDLEIIVHANEIEIKITQVAKVGQGGFLPSPKVNDEIAEARNCEPGTPLHSMGAHASIKSIEDLGQLVFGLKEVNPHARVAVKLGSGVGVDNVAIGVIKDLADRVNFSGVGAGTGAALESAQQHGGMPWELYLPKAHRMAVFKKYRDRVEFSADGGMSTPMDFAFMTALGGEASYYGKIIMYVLGCTNMAVCDLNLCAFGDASMDPELRKNYTGRPEYVEAFFRQMAKGIQRQIVALGCKNLDELRGKMGKLIKHTRMLDRNLDFSNQLDWFEGSNIKCGLKKGERNEYVDPQYPKRISIDEEVWAQYRNQMLDPFPWSSPLIYIDNTRRNTGSRISYYLATEFDYTSNKNHKVILNLEGIGAGQQLGFFGAKGLTLNLTGSANDGVAEGNSGSIVILKPKEGTHIFRNSHENSILGNHAAYGQTSGEDYFGGRSANNYAYGFKGGIESNEGVGANAYRFMTNGFGVSMGTHFGPGMFAGAGGGAVCLYDPKNVLQYNVDLNMTGAIFRLEDFKGTQEIVRRVMENHAAYTGTLWSNRLLQNFALAAKDFKLVVPKALRIHSPTEQDIEDTVKKAANINNLSNPQIMLQALER